MAVFSSLLGVRLPYLAEVVILILVAYAAAYLITMLYFARKHKFTVPGPIFVPPFVGGLISMIRDPFSFWEKQRSYCPHGYSWVAILMQFVVFVTRADLCHKIFATNSESTLTLQLHPNGRVILGDNNVAFQSGPQHKALRASFMNLFTTKALSLYLPIQERIIHKYLADWVKKYPKGGKPEEMRGHIRDMNCLTSQTVFMGEHLHNREEFTENYNTITRGFLAAPIYFPGTALYKAVQARKKVMDELQAAVRRSKLRMSLPDAEAHCLLDFWSATILETLKSCEEEGVEPPAYTSDHAMADTMLDFLFASQDASTASLTMITATMSDRPDILQRVREEQDKLRVGDEPLTYELVQEMTFTRQCVLEQLRLFPPAPMVPMKAHSDFVIDDKFTVPRGSLIIPSLVGSCREGFTNPDVYDPDRMGPERQEDRKFAKQFIPFGVGPHRCVGYNYAINHLTVYLALVAHAAEWTRVRTPKSDEVLYLPTLYPYDCLCTWAYRGNKEESKVESVG
ncbi:Cytochrome P450 [Trypanosoma melophagium]|uniref:Cytochrome P450 n=1 Tax=Trypanosoma melophagium TaxID=715481 RepID=UPI00351A289B|nr:Cytochrome P450 [Trypanosoma melophagium]